VLPPPPHYEPCQEFLLQGDIGHFPFIQIVKMNEEHLLPSTEMPPPSKAIPSYPGMVETAIAIDRVPYGLRRWHGLGIVVDQTSELQKYPADSRVTVAPLVPAAASGLNWATAVAGQYAGVLVLPSCDAGAALGGMPKTDWPEVVVAFRSVTTTSRAIAEAGRMMTVTPKLAALLAAKLAEMYGERTWARLKHFSNVLGQTLEEIDDLGKPDEPPATGRWALLSFSNHERLQVFVSPKD